MQERTIFVQLFFYPQNRLQMNPFSFFHCPVIPLYLFFLLALPTIGTAQDFPPNAVAGKCYAKCHIPEQYENVTEQILLKDASTRIEIIPAVYDTVDIVVTEQAPYTIYELQAPEFSIVEDQVRTRDSSEILRYVPPIFETVEETVLVKPAGTVWRKTHTPNCVQVDGSECVVWCLHEIVAEYKTVKKQVIKVPARIERTVSPPQYTTLRKTLVSKPASVTKREVEAKTRIIKKVVLKTPAQQTVVDVPAEYSTITSKRRLKVGGFSDWVEVLCESKVTTSKVARIQQMLRAKGYNPGAANNVLGPETRRALLQYQKDNGLPAGNINMETIRSLGVDDNGASYSEPPVPQVNVQTFNETLPPPPAETAAPQENDFKQVAAEPLSTFSIDVDKASYSNIRGFFNMPCRTKKQADSLERAIKIKGTNSPDYNNMVWELNRTPVCTMPPPEQVRIEEFINYFPYEYPAPSGKDAFSITTETGKCPWNEQHYLVHVGLQGKKLSSFGELPPANLVFLIDVSGSMGNANKLPLLKESLSLLVAQLREQDSISIVVYAGAAGLVLPPTSGSQKQVIRESLERLSAGGSTAGGAGLQLAYQTAQQAFRPNGINRVILATDGDFNVGISSPQELEDYISVKRKTGIYLSVLGFGRGNYQDQTMELLADKGNGNCSYIDDLKEAEKTLVKEGVGTLFTIAKDVKIQVEFNPNRVQAYRLIGYENRMLATEDFNNDAKDAGELGAGHTVTALYEIIPLAGNAKKVVVNEAVFAEAEIAQTQFKTDDLMAVKFRYKTPESPKSTLITQTVKFSDLGKYSDNFRFSSAVAAFGMLLQNSKYKGRLTYDRVLEMARPATVKDPDGYRKEFLELVQEVRRRQ